MELLLGLFRVGGEGLVIVFLIVKYLIELLLLKPALFFACTVQAYLCPSVNPKTVASEFVVFLVDLLPPYIHLFNVASLKANSYPVAPETLYQSNVWVVPFNVELLLGLFRVGGEGLIIVFLTSKVL